MKQIPNDFGQSVWLLEDGDRVRTTETSCEGLEIALHRNREGVSVRSTSNEIATYPEASNVVRIAEVKS